MSLRSICSLTALFVMGVFVVSCVAVPPPPPVTPTPTAVLQPTAALAAATAIPAPATVAPTTAPTATTQPTTAPTAAPTTAPTSAPTATTQPTTAPTSAPTAAAKPTAAPTTAPAASATAAPTAAATSASSGSQSGKIDMNKLLPPGKGQSLLLNNCTSCHSFICAIKGQRTADYWQTIKLGHRERVGSMTDDDYNALFSYLAENFNDKKPVPEIPPELADLGCSAQ